MSGWFILPRSYKFTKVFVWNICGYIGYRYMCRRYIQRGGGKCLYSVWRRQDKHRRRNIGKCLYQLFGDYKPFNMGNPDMELFIHSTNT